MCRPCPSILLVAAVCCLATSFAAAQPPAPDRLAVLELANPAGLTDQETAYLTRLVRASAREVLPPGRFVIMTRENIYDLLGDQALTDCIGECAVETGRNLGAAYVAAGEVVRFGQSLRISLTLHETDSGNLLKSVQVKGASVEDLEAPVREQSLVLFRPLRRGGPGGGAGGEMALGGAGSVWSATGGADVVVRFESEPPGAMVEVDGLPLCETPCSRPLAAGTAEVAFKLLRYVPVSRLVEVAEGIETVREELTPNFGWLSVTSEPAGMTVEIDGEAVGVTPLRRREIGLGGHEVWVRGDVWHDVGERIAIDRGEHQQVQLAPLPINGGLKVQAVDRDGNAVAADVTVDGRIVGRTWAALTLQAGQHEVSVVAEGGRWSGSVTVPKEDLLVLDAEIGIGAGLRASSVTIEVVRVEPGEYRMGSPSSEKWRDDDELRHTVRLTRSFLIGATEVTQADYEAVMGSNHSRFKGSDRPVHSVTWYECVEFCNRLSELEGLTPAYQRTDDVVTWNRSADGYRLPTEAEWEYACRAGTRTAHCAGDSRYELRPVAWYDANSGDKMHSVGKKMPNRFGLHDMHGNVWEWCWDWYGDYPAGRVSDPSGPSRGEFRVARGGSCCDNDGASCRSANRNYDRPENGYWSYGFRVARNAPTR